MTAKATRRYNLRATDEQAAMIDAAMQLGNERSVTDYILGSAVMVAEQRLMARKDFHLNSRQYQQFLDALERPVQDKSRPNANVVDERCSRKHGELKKKVPGTT